MRRMTCISASENASRVCVCTLPSAPRLRLNAVIVSSSPFYDYNDIILAKSLLSGN